MAFLLSFFLVLAQASTADTRWQLGLASCQRGIDEQIAQYDAKARGIAAVAPTLSITELRRLKLRLAPVPLDRTQFRMRFNELAAMDPVATSLLTLLAKENVPVNFTDASRSTSCQGNQIAFFTPGSHPEVGMCLRKNEIMGRSIVGFIHEGLHLFQFNHGPVKELLMYPYNGSVRTSSRALKYTPHAKYIQYDSDYAEKGARILDSLPPALKNKTIPLLLSLDEIKTLYMMYSKKERIDFLPKKPWILGDEKFFDLLEEKLSGKKPWDEETADLKFTIVKMQARDSTVSKGDPDAAVKMLAPGWYDWIKKNRGYQGRPRKIQLQRYLQELEQDFDKTAKMAEADPETRAQFQELFNTFFISSRVMRGLLNYCAEMQANMQSEMLLYLFYRELQTVSACKTFLPSVWEVSRPEENIFSPNFPNDFEKVDAEIERFVKKRVSRTQSYGPSFSFLYGYENFPNFFSASSCMQYKEDFMYFRP